MGVIAVTPSASTSSLRKSVRRFLRHRPAVFAACVVSVYVLAAVLAPLITPYDPLDMSAGRRLAPPDPGHWFGTDEFGRDVFSRLAYGARIALTVGIGSSAIALAIGGTIGILGGYIGGWADRIATMVIDMLYAFPALLLAIALAVFLNPSTQTVIIAISVVQTPHYARVTRGAVLAAKGLQYVEAARAVGATGRWIVLRHVLPNIRSPIVVQAGLSFSYAVLSESTLSFLGVGNPPPAPSWGAMLTGSYSYLQQAPWAAVFPGLAITMLILGMNLLSDGMQDLLDPTRRQ
jgi:ABC-type dipeptide/oligopeptide/nickel transport system permease subunit